MDSYNRLRKPVSKDRCTVTMLFALGYPLLGFANLSSGNWFIGESVGSSLPLVNHTQFIDSGMGGWPHDRYENDPISATAGVSLLGGYQWETQHQWLPFYSLELNYTHPLSSTLKGTVFQFNLPQFENYSYRYNIQRNIVLGLLKATIVRYRNILPYVSFGAGLSVNRANAYQETAMPNVFFPRISPDFQSHTSTQFSYRIGAGVDYAVYHNWWVGVDYYYGRYGSSSTNWGVSTWSNARLNPKISDNAVYFTIHYFFNQKGTSA